MAVRSRGGQCNKCTRAQRANPSRVQQASRLENRKRLIHRHLRFRPRKYCCTLLHFAASSAATRNGDAGSRRDRRPASDANEKSGAFWCILVHRALRRFAANWEISGNFGNPARAGSGRIRMSKNLARGGSSRPHARASISPRAARLRSKARSAPRKSLTALRKRGKNLSATIWRAARF